MKSRTFQDRLKRRNAFSLEIKWKVAKSMLRDELYPNSYRFKVANFLSSFPTKSSFTKINNRCNLTARSRSVYKDFRISRLMFRKLALQGQLMGVKKSSW